MTTPLGGRRRYAGMRSVLEVPILKPRYWAKVPEVDADAIMLDLEDSATPSMKDHVRGRVVEALADRSYFGDRHVVVRTNNLATPWGRADLEALSEVDADVLVCYPKVRDAAELAEAREILSSRGTAHGLYVMIETAAAVLDLERIAAERNVVGLHFGYVDYAADVGSRPFAESGDDLFAPANHYVRAKIAVAAAANDLFATGGTLIPEYRDLAKVAAFVRSWAALGYSGCVVVSPAHLPVVNETFRPSAEEVARAETTCRAYEAAVDRGDPAAVVDGTVVTLPDYRVASLVLARSVDRDHRMENR
ncbi:HpcH/HpaI aldolase/citrate lyase family protein [Pseudonocardia xishanensis]|uniref:(3S)-malyl-CoA thioesterase n=1 Tax=Pseudonocardia xishanensis TaxID=630995 RepID=A0ABP8RVC9_9PSEU